MQGYLDKYTPMVGEGHITIFPWHYSSITQGTWVWNANASQLYYGYLYNSSNTQDDQIDYKVYLDIGTYTFVTLTITTVNLAIITLLIDGGSVGTIDFYSASGIYNVIKSISGISITSAGLKTASLKAATKNASSTGWYSLFGTLCFYRTA